MKLYQCQAPMDPIRIKYNNKHKHSAHNTRKYTQLHFLSGARSTQNDRYTSYEEVFVLQ